MGNYSTANLVRSHGRDYRKGEIKHTLTPEQKLAGLERSLARYQTERDAALLFGRPHLVTDRMIALTHGKIEEIQAEMAAAPEFLVEVNGVEVQG